MIQANTSFSGLIGVAREDITPPAGIYSRNWGAAEYDVADGIHQPLTLTVITFQSQSTDKPLVLVGADLGWWKNAGGELIFRNKLLNILGLDASRLMFCLSHTHAGPSICADDKISQGGELIEPYLESIISKTAKATLKAMDSAVKADLTWTYGQCNLAANRDLPQPEKQRSVVGFNPANEADDTLLVGRITDSAHKTIATIINYACHPTTLAWQNRLISPDYVGSMRELVESSTAAPCLFLQGASGELAPREQYTGDTSIADKHGRQLGYAVLSALQSMNSPEKELALDSIVESGAPLAVWKQSSAKSPPELSVIMKEVKYTLKELPSLAEIDKEYQECTDRVMKERLWRKRSIRIDLGDSDIVNVPLWIWKLGNSFLIGQPNEAYSEFQVELRKELAPDTVAVMNIVNGSIGYLPPASLFEKDIYSVWQSPFAKGSLENLIKTASDSAKSLKD